MNKQTIQLLRNLIWAQQNNAGPVNCNGVPRATLRTLEKHGLVEVTDFRGDSSTRISWRSWRAG